MSLQELTIANKGSEGIRKQIDQNSIDVVFDVLQVYAYSNPIESTVRELTSNAVDAQREKEIAIEILEGKSKVEDYFIQKHGKEFEDSKFNPDYYNLDFLEASKNNVELEYHDKEGSGFCDLFIVRDNGVGIGEKRLEGILKLGFSTKRNSKELIGGYGLGQKAALSTLAPFYTLITSHNGKLFKLNIYSKKADSLIGKFNDETGEENPFVIFNVDDPDPKKHSIVYYETTTSKNFTETQVPVKKLNKHKFIEAVSSQLLYLPNVKFTIFEKGRSFEEDFKATILYESENLIISNNTQFSRPHLIVVKDKNSNAGICYNEIDYKELELEQRYGKVALKVQTRAVSKDSEGNEILINEGIAVTPNRENVIWNDDTKNYLLKITKNVTLEATEIVNKELQETDFIKWITKATTVMSSVKYGSVLYELSEMINKENILPTYPLDKSIKFTNVSNLFYGFKLRFVHTERHYPKGSNISVERVVRDDIDRWEQFTNRKIFLKTSDTSNTKDRYILQEILKQDSDYQKYSGFVMVEFEDMDAILDDALSKLATEEDKKSFQTGFLKKITKKDAVLTYLKASADTLDYDTIEVPEDFKVATETSETAIENALQVKDYISPSEMRKLNGEIVFHTCRPDSYYNHDRELVWNKEERKLSSLVDLSKRIYYGFNDDSETLKNACRILGRDKEHWFNKDISIIKISKSNEKHLKNVGDHINKFFYNLDENNSIIMTPEIVKYWTGRMISEKLDEKFNFIKNYESINKEIFKIREYLVEYVKIHYSNSLRLRNVTSFDAEKSLLETFKKYAEFQLFVADNKDNNIAIAEKSKELFDIAFIKDCQIVDLKELRRVEVLEEYANEIHHLFNHVDCLVSTSYDSPSKEIIKLLKIILKAKNLDDFTIDDDLLITK